MPKGPSLAGNGVRERRGVPFTGMLMSDKEIQLEEQDPAMLLSGMLPDAIGDLPSSESEEEDTLKLPAHEDPAPVGHAKNKAVSPLWGEWSEEQVCCPFFVAHPPCVCPGNRIGLSSPALLEFPSVGGCRVATAPYFLSSASKCELELRMLCSVDLCLRRAF